VVSLRVVEVIPNLFGSTTLQLQAVDRVQQDILVHLLILILRPLDLQVEHLQLVVLAEQSAVE